MQGLPKVAEGYEVVINRCTENNLICLNFANRDAVRNDLGTWGLIELYIDSSEHIVFLQAGHVVHPGK